MARYTDEQEISFDVDPQERSIVVDANGGSVTVSAYDGVDYIDTDVISADGATVIFTAGLRLKFTPAGGAAYYIDESNRAS